MALNFCARTGPASKELGEKIAQLLGVQTVPVFFKTFPDSESYVRLEGTVEGARAIIRIKPD